MLNPTSLALAGTGSANQKTFTATETGFKGAFSTSGCSSIATAVVGSTSLGSATITVTGQGIGGLCALTVSDGNGISAVLPITVSVTTVTGS